MIPTGFPSTDPSTPEGSVLLADRSMMVPICTKTLDYLYETELYVVPKRTANKSEKTDSLQYLVGGRSVTNPKKAELIGQMHTGDGL